MSEAPLESLEQIGQTAGVVWRTLNENGPMSMTKLLKKIGGSRDNVLLALGWLAREDKNLVGRRPQPDGRLARRSELRGRRKKRSW